MKTVSVDCFDLDGNIIESYDSVKEAAMAADCNQNNLYRSIVKGIPYKNYLYKFSDRKTFIEEVPNLTQIEINRYLDDMESKKEYIKAVLKSYYYIPLHDWDDLKQEIAIVIWKSYEWYLKNWTASFRKFLIIRIHWVVRTYLSRHYRNHIWKTNHVEDFSFFEVFAQVHEVDEIDCLEKAIKALPEEDQRILAVYMYEEVSLNEYSAKMGKRVGYYNQRVSKIRKKIYDNRHRFFSGDLLKEKELSKSSLSQLGKMKKSNCVPVFQFDKNGIHIIQKFESVNDAASFHSVGATSIVASIRRKSQLCAGYLWRYATSEN